MTYKISDDIMQCLKDITGLSATEINAALKAYPELHEVHACFALQAEQLAILVTPPEARREWNKNYSRSRYEKWLSDERVLTR